MTELLDALETVSVLIGLCAEPVYVRANLDKAAGLATQAIVGRG
jgi:hypothetical protein